jgi:altronate dehydratase
MGEMRTAINSKISQKKFKGFRRIGRRPGTRNDLWIMPADGGLYSQLRAMAVTYHKPYWIDRVVLIAPSNRPGCAEIFSQLAVNPNAAGALIVGREEESSIFQLLKRIKFVDDSGKQVRGITIQPERPAESEEKFNTTLDIIASNVSRTRISFNLSNLCVGVERYEGHRTGERDSAERFLDWFASRGGMIIPANVPLSGDLLAAGGAQVILSGLGVGAPRGGMVPTVKISAAGARIWAEDRVGISEPQASGPPPMPVTYEFELLSDYILRVASGVKTADEPSGFAEVKILEDPKTGGNRSEDAKDLA